MLQRKEGYYVYYEKNPQMQDYMIESRKNPAQHAVLKKFILYPNQSADKVSCKNVT